ncbi:MAG: hypothetical protein CMG00_05030 [Candidatus Marinimicrobia bacterium]|nr:hypothetical protein [Candidatus Neomarinimicrobiota bacterium]|tara:strand:+ start:7707 stop:8495 length:789 start_codon:yes stop_codon:yes gene_type:complete
MWPGFEFMGFNISSFGLMMFLAFLSCNILIRKTLSEKKVEVEVGDNIIFWAALGGIIGAKLYYMFEFGFHSSHEGFLYIIDGDFKNAIHSCGSGLVFYGGLIGGLIAVSIYLFRNKLSWLEYSDVVAPLLALGHSIGRVGCFLVHDCDGIRTSFDFFPLAVQFPDENFYRFPTQLYEMAIYFVIFLYLYNFRNKINFKGELFFEYLFLIGVSRFLIEFIREHPVSSEGFSFMFLGLSGAQYISLLMIISGILLHYGLRRKIM